MTPGLFRAPDTKTPSQALDTHRGLSRLRADIRFDNGAELKHACIHFSFRRLRAVVSHPVLGEIDPAYSRSTTAVTPYPPVCPFAK